MVQRHLFPVLVAQKRVQVDVRMHFIPLPTLLNKMAKKGSGTRWRFFPHKYILLFWNRIRIYMSLPVKTGLVFSYKLELFLFWMNGLNFLARPVGNNEMASAPIKKMWEVPASPNQTDRGAKGGAPAKYRAPLQPKSGMFSPLPRKRTKRKGAKVAIRKSSGLDHWGGIQFREMLLIVRKFKRVFAFPKMIKKNFEAKKSRQSKGKCPFDFSPFAGNGKKKTFAPTSLRIPVTRSHANFFSSEKSPPPEERRKTGKCDPIDRKDEQGERKIRKSSFWTLFLRR